ncbi:MAG: hypothetical protein HGA82_03505, partial [Anaerolineales bacterium]|nr:hypothetical protein [Anaerolineales bacterium]
PRTQSALLECMGERQVTVDGMTRSLVRPFIVLATQNPIEYEGTFPLPEAQLDRFLIKMQLGYLDPATESQMLLNLQCQHPIETVSAVVDGACVPALAHLVWSLDRRVHLLRHDRGGGWLGGVVGAYVDDVAAAHIRVVAHEIQVDDADRGAAPRLRVGILEDHTGWADHLQDREFAFDHGIPFPKRVYLGNIA